MKILLFIVYFLLVTIVATAMKPPEKTVPPITDAMLVVGIFFALIYGVLKLIKKILKKEHSASVT